MSSLRNASQRRTHRERAQPFERRKHGLLEKKKDYSRRAKDFNEKKERLRLLREKAAQRNPDEFAFGMMSAKVDKFGIKVADRGNKPLSHDVVKLLKTQDAGYLRTNTMHTMRERQRLEEEIQILEKKGPQGIITELRVLKEGEKGGSRRHIVFVDDEASQQSFIPEQRFATDKEGLLQSYNRPRRLANDENLLGAVTEEDQKLSQTPQPHQPQNKRSKDAQFQAWRLERAVQKKRQKAQGQKRTRLEALKARENALLLAERELDVQRAKMSNSIGGVTKHGVKFKIRERRR